MKIIKTKNDINLLVKGDSYIISPKGIDYNKPEELHKFQDEINSIQEAIENKIKKDNENDKDNGNEGLSEGVTTKKSKK